MHTFTRVELRSPADLKNLIKMINKPDYVILFLQDLEAPEFDTCQSISEETNHGIATAMVTWSGLAATDNSGIVPNVTCQPTSGNKFPIGTTVVICNATDNSGNTATCSFEVIIVGMYSKLPIWCVCLFVCLFVCLTGRSVRTHT